MEPNYRDIIKKHHVEIRRVLDSDQVLPYVIEKGVMSDEEIEKIRAKSTRFEKADTFMEVLKRGSHGAFDVFVKALEKVHPHLACLLLRSVIDHKTDELAKCKCELKVSNAFTTKSERECERIREELKIAKEQKKDAERKHEEEMGATSRSIPTARVFSYKSDFNEKGIHAQGTNAQASSAQERVNIGGKKDRLPAIIGTQFQPSTSKGKGKAKQPPNNEKGSTEEQRRSSWYLDLGEKCSLFLTHFTMRHARDSCSYNWDLQGSRDGENWEAVLYSQKKHESDDTHSPCMTETWLIEGEVEAYRFFRIPHMGENSSGLRFDMYVNGMELHGVLLDMSR